MPGLGGCNPFPDGEHTHDSYLIASLENSRGYTGRERAGKEKCYRDWVFPFPQGVLRGETNTRKTRSHEEITNQPGGLTA